MRKKPYSDGGGRTICFVDVESADHAVELLDDQGRAHLESTLVFEVQAGEAGRPVIDLNDPQATRVVELVPDGGSPVSPVPQLKEVHAPKGETLYAYLDHHCAPGRYTLRIEQKGSKKRRLLPKWPPRLPHNDPYATEYEDVRLFLRMSDVDLGDSYYGKRPPGGGKPCDGGHQVESDYAERLSLERYLPAGLEYDEYPLTLRLSAPKVSQPFLRTSGLVTGGASGPWTLTFPADSVPFPFVFLGEDDGVGGPNFVSRTVRYTRSDGTGVDIEVFGHRSRAANVALHASDALKAMPQLEFHLGRCPYTALTLYSAGEAMEYSGAAEVAGSHVAHELAHMWFGRSLRPDGGDAGWIDEAVAHWCEEFAMSPNPPARGSDMGNRGEHHRGTAALDARRVGKPLLEFLNHRINATSGRRLGQFLSYLRISYNGRITTPDFQRELERWAGMGFDAEFKTFVLGQMSHADYIQNHRP